MSDQTPQWDYIPTYADYHDAAEDEYLTARTRIDTLEDLIRTFIKARKDAEACSDLLLSDGVSQKAVDLMWELTKAEKALEDAVTPKVVEQMPRTPHV